MPAAPPLLAATTLAFATSVVDGIAFARSRVRRKCMGPLGNDFGSIAVIVAVLRQFSEAGGVINQPALIDRVALVLGGS